MNGGKNRQPLGYTIVEVMIVLAVSGLMFVIAANFINGKEARSAFSTGVNQMASQIQSTIEQVTDGHYSDIPLDCSFSLGSTQPNTPPVGTPAQGTNADCVFLGKLLRFTPNSSNYKLFSLAGGRVTGATTPTLASVDPTIIDTLTNAQNVPQSLQVIAMSVTDATTGASFPDAYNFGFLQSLGTSNSGTFQSGGQTISMVYSPIGLGAADSAINGNLAYAQTVTICVSDGTPGPQLAKIVLGGAGESQLNVAVHHLNGGASCP